MPRVSLIVAAHDEEDVIAERVADALALDYPRERLEVVVASDGSTDATVERARAAGADLVLDLERAGKVPAQNSGAARASGELLAFSDANAAWRPDALRRLVARFADPKTGYVTGRVEFTAPDLAGGGGSASEEGAYWRFELGVRRLESALAGVTAGNGAIYAVRREAYIELPAAASHDLSFPFLLTKRGWRCSYEPAALAEERMAPTNEAEFARKRRMMRGIWDEVVRDGMLSPRGYGLAYAWEIASHRILRYATPALHLIALASNVALLGAGTVYIAHPRRAGARPPRRRRLPGAFRRGRCGSPATTCSPPPRSPRASGTASGSGRRGRGIAPRARGERRPRAAESGRPADRRPRAGARGAR